MDSACERKLMLLPLECHQALVCNKHAKAGNTVTVGTDTSSTVPRCLTSPQELTTRGWQTARVSLLWKALLKAEGPIPG